MTANDDALFTSADGGLRLSNKPIVHRSDEYAEENFGELLRMQHDHFWYVGRHRFMLNALRRGIGRRQGLHAIDLGGGCGGWLAYLHHRHASPFDELALADSSLEALRLAAPVVDGFASRYQVDLHDLGWKERWDVVFLLDVLEHLHDDAGVLRQIQAAMRPGGLLFVTTPALEIFRTYNDEIVHHLRRYNRCDFEHLASVSSLKLLRSRYFMFFLSPLLLASRWMHSPAANMTPDEIRTLLARTHSIPPAFINVPLRALFSLETPLGWHIPFPWGSSILGVFEKA
jgi:2-polyprenyl-3-methyl-5-hydroxy-6-metoxy-1,4-benzoquinol methylase